LQTLGKDLNALTPDDLALVDELHIGGRPASLALFAQCGFVGGTRVLDVGSGLGGPARTCANAHGVRVTGIDLTPEYVEIARSLSARVGLAATTTFQQASALDLPFGAAEFDGAYMIHVGMNIADKGRLLREVRRVLRDGGTFGIYDVMRRTDGELSYPVPWSSSPETSFVERSDAYAAALAEAGFGIAVERDRLEFAMDFFAPQASRGASGTAPALGHRGPDFPTKARNLHAMLKAGLLGPKEIIARAR
jgi:MPBQ/MSBQ methyltransferase